MGARCEIRIVSQSLGQLRRLRRPLVVRRLTVAGAAAADDDDAAHATRGDDEAAEHVIGGGDRTEVVRLWRGRRLVATYVSPRAWQRLGGDRARDGAALLRGARRAPRHHRAHVADEHF